jgi:hypothetical protein
MHRIYGDFITFNVNSDFECEEDMTAFVSSRLIMKAVSDDRMFIVRTDWTWSEYKIESDEKLLLITLGYARVPENVVPEYIPIAQCRTRSIGNLLMLDKSNPRFAHSVVEGVRTGFDVIFDEELPTDAEGYDIDTSGMILLHPESDGKYFEIMYRGSKLEVGYKCQNEEV